MPSYLAKPVSPRVYHRAGAPSVWFLMDSPRRDGAGGPGDVADLMHRTPAGVRAAGVEWEAGPDGAVLLFPGGAPVTLGAGPETSFGSGVSMTICVRHFDPTGPVSGTTALVAKDGTTAREWAITFANRQLTFLTFDAGGTPHTVTQSSPVQYTAGRWNFVVAGYDAALGKSFLSLNAGPLMYGAGQGDVRTGAEPCTVGASHFYQDDAQKIGDVRFYPRALTPAEIARDYADPYWRLRPTSNVAVMQAPSGSGASFYDPFGGPTGHPLVSGGLVH